jgi:hypothetical protein
MTTVLTAGARAVDPRQEDNQRRATAYWLRRPSRVGSPSGLRASCDRVAREANVLPILR